MKKKILKFLLMNIIIFSSLVGCGKNEENTLKDTNEQSVNEQVESNESSNNVSGKYVSELLKLDKLTKDYAGKIEDVLANHQGLYYLIGNDVYTNMASNIVKVASVYENAVKLMPTTGFGNILVGNSDGTYSLFKQFDSGSDQNKAAPTEFLNQKLSDAFYIQDAVGYSFLVFKLKDNRIYVDFYDKKDDGVILDENNLEFSLKIKTSAGEKTVSGEVKQVYNDLAPNIMIVYENGDAYSLRSPTLSSYGTQAETTLYRNEDLKNVERIYSAEDNLSYSTAMYSEIGDNRNLYVYKGAPYKSEGGVPEEQYKYSLSLPEGYVIDDIKQVKCEMDVLLELNNGNIYIAEDFSSDPKNGKFILQEELSKLNKAGFIKEVFHYGFNYYILMDDGIIYKVDL